MYQNPQGFRKPCGFFNGFVTLPLHLSLKKTYIMKELCIPVPDLGDSQAADIELTINGKKMKYQFRIETFPWDTEDELSAVNDKTSTSLARIHRLKSSIENYDKNWELIQIYNPAEHAKYIQVLYRKRNS